MICRDAKRRLKEATDAKGRKLEVIELPLDADHSHFNFYIANDCVLVPTSTSKNGNDRALAILREVFPKREIVGV